MKKLAIFLILILSMAFSGCSFENASDKEEVSKPSEMDMALEKVVNRDDGKSLAGLAVVAIKGGDVAYKNAFGCRYIDNENADNSLPFKTDTKMRIASVSKSFVAVAIMQLVEAGKIDLSEDVSKYLGFELRNPNYQDIPITCTMLLSHTSGLRDGDVYSTDPKYNLSEFFQTEGKFYENGAHFAPAGQAPGEYFSYCNLNYGILGTIIESVTGQRFDKYMDAKVMKPMGITASFDVASFDAETMNNLAVCYRKEYDADGFSKKGSEWIAQIDNYKGKIAQEDTLTISNPDSNNELTLISIKDYKPGTNATSFSPQGGLRISADELAIYAKMYMNDGKINDTQILKKESVDKMFTPVWTWNGREEGTNGDAEFGLFACYGLGIHIITNGKYNDGYGDTFLEEKPIDVAGHYGDAHGAFSIFMVDREKNEGFVYLCNGTECDYYNEPSYGTYSENWIWEEEIVTNLYKYVLEN